VRPRAALLDVTPPWRFSWNDVAVVDEWPEVFRPGVPLEHEACFSQHEETRGMRRDSGSSDLRLR
jgi:hypothetical protein